MLFVQYKYNTVDLDELSKRNKFIKKIENCSIVHNDNRTICNTGITYHFIRGDPIVV